MTMLSNRPPLRVLVLCTRDSARSQMGEALLHSMSEGRVHAANAPLDEPTMRAALNAGAHELGYESQG